MRARNTIRSRRERADAIFNRGRRVVFNADGSWDADVVTMPAALLDVGVRYMEELTKKALLISQTLQKSGVPHAVIGGLALAAHVARVDSKAERNTQDLDIILNRADLERAKKALDPVGYRYRKVMRLHAFLPKTGKPDFVDGVHIIWGGEKVYPEYSHPAPTPRDDRDYISPEGVRYLGLLDLLIMKLTSFRLKDQVHIQDLIRQKLITKKIEHALPADLRERFNYVKTQTKREKP